MIQRQPDQMYDAMLDNRMQMLHTPTLTDNPTELQLNNSRMLLLHTSTPPDNLTELQLGQDGHARAPAKPGIVHTQHNAST
jgi:hypothetical protein